MSEANLDINIRGNSSGFGAVAQETVRQINGIRTAIRELPTSAIRSLGSSLAAFFSFDYIRERIREVVEYSGAISDMSARIGVSTQFLQQAEFAARQTGGSLGDVTNAIRELQRSQVGALRNQRGGDANAFAAMGISIAQLRNMSPEALFTRIAQAIGEGEVNSLQLDAAVQLLGRSASAVLPMMRQGYSDLAQAAQDAGIVINDELIEQLDELGDESDRLMAQMRVGWAMLAGGIASAVNTAMNYLDRLSQGIMAVWDNMANGATDAPHTTPLDAFRNAWEATATGQAQEEEDQNRARAERRNRARSPLEIPQRPAGNGGGTGGGINSDALQRIGLFISGGPSGIEMQRRQLTELRNISTLQRETIAAVQRV